MVVQEVSAVSPRTVNSAQRQSRRMMIAAAAITLVWSVYIAVGTKSHYMQWAANIVLPLSIVALVVVAVTRRSKLQQVLGSLDELLTEIRAGQMPIESLDSVNAALNFNDPDAKVLQSIVGQVQESLRDVKRQKLELSKLHEEIRQRIATRTDALERTIGGLRTAATRDPLTALGNRRMLDASLPKLIEACRIAGAPLAVMAIDVDRFKQLNDTLGHPAGDAFLRDLAQLFRSTIRPDDIAFRVGGDEFVILLTKCTTQGAGRLCARLTSLVDALASTIRVPLPPGISIGIAELVDAHSAGGTELLALADQNLYSVKHARGRTRGCTAA